MGGVIPLPEEIVYEIQHLLRVTTYNGSGNHNGAGHLRSVQTI